MGDESLKPQTTAYADPLGLPLQCFPLGAVAHEEYLGARVLEQPGGRNQGAYTLLGGEPANEQDARLPNT